MHKTFYVSDDISNRAKDVISTPHRQDLSYIRQLENNVHHVNKCSPYSSDVSIPIRKQIELKRTVISRNNNAIRLVIDDDRNKHNFYSERLKLRPNGMFYSNKPTVIKASPYNIELSQTEDSRQRSLPIGLKIPLEAEDELNLCMRTAYSSNINKMKLY